MTGTIIPLIRCGTSGSVLRGFAQRWVDDPNGTYCKELDKADSWCCTNGLPTRHMLYHPAGARPFGSPGTMQFEQYPMLMDLRASMAQEIARIFRMDSEHADRTNLVYLGSLPAYDWRTRRDVAECVCPYAVAGKTALVIDQLNGWPDTIPNRKCIEGLKMAFAEVIGEGGLTAEDDWMEVGIMHTADAHERIYAKKPEKYRQPQYVLISNAPDVPDKNQWKRDQCRLWLSRQVDCIIDVDVLDGVSFAELTAT